MKETNKERIFNLSDILIRKTLNINRSFLLWGQRRMLQDKLRELFHIQHTLNKMLAMRESEPVSCHTSSGYSMNLSLLFAGKKWNVGKTWKCQWFDRGQYDTSIYPICSGRPLCSAWILAMAMLSNFLKTSASSSNTFSILRDTIHFSTVESEFEEVNESHYVKYDIQWTHLCFCWTRFSIKGVTQDKSNLAGYLEAITNNFDDGSLVILWDWKRASPSSCSSC